MNKFIITATGLLMAATAFAAEVEWKPRSSDDIRIESLPASMPAPPASRHQESEPVRYAWPLEVDSEQSAAGGPSMDSREYWVDTSGRELAEGLELPLSAPGALVRLSALHSDTDLLLDARELQLEVDGRSLDVTRDSDGARLVTGADLRAQGMSVPEDTLAFRLPRDGQPSTLSLQHRGAPADQSLVVHVFEPESRWQGRLSAPRHHYMAGQELNLEVGLSDGERLARAESIQAVLVSPDADRSWPLEVTGDGLGLTGRAPERLPASGPGLYEVHAYLDGRNGETVIRRDIKLAVNIAVPTARLTERAEVRSERGLVIDLGVEAAAQGRYQISGQVWGSDRNGEMQPLAMTQSAAVLASGRNKVQLEVPAELVADSGLSAPFEVRQIELMDQGRMALLESHSGGLVITRDGDDSRQGLDR